MIIDSFAPLNEASKELVDYGYTPNLLTLSYDLKYSFQELIKSEFPPLSSHYEKVHLNYGTCDVVISDSLPLKTIVLTGEMKPLYTFSTVKIVKEVVLSNVEILV